MINAEFQNVHKSRKELKWKFCVIIVFTQINSDVILFS